MLTLVKHGRFKKSNQKQICETWPSPSLLQAKVNLEMKSFSEGSSRRVAERSFKPQIYKFSCTAIAKIRWTVRNWDVESISSMKSKASYWKSLMKKTFIPACFQKEGGRCHVIYLSMVNSSNPCSSSALTAVGYAFFPLLQSLNLFSIF